MSAEAIGWTFKHSPYSGAQLCVHLAIADVVNDGLDNEFFMGVDKLAAKARASRRTAQSSLKQFVDDGYLRVVRPATQHYPTCYQFVFEQLAVKPAPLTPTPDSGVQNLHPSEPGVQSTTTSGAAVRGAISDTPGAQSDAPRGATTAPKPKEPKKNPKSSSSSGVSSPRPETAEDDDDRIPAAARLHAVERLDRRRVDEANGKTLDPIGDTEAWLDAAAARWHTRYADDIALVLQGWPDADAEQLVALVAEHALPTRLPSQPAPAGRQPTELGCANCEQGWIDNGNGGLERCPDCAVSGRNHQPQGATA